VNSYDKGDNVRVTATFASGGLDPTTVVAKVRNPSGTTTTYTYGLDNQLVKSATGVYYVDVNLNAAGTWWVRFESTGTGQAAQELGLFVPTPQVS
jgi:hypothetical protein